MLVSGGKQEDDIFWFCSIGANFKKKKKKARHEPDHVIEVQC